MRESRRLFAIGKIIMNIRIGTSFISIRIRDPDSPEPERMQGCKEPILCLDDQEAPGNRRQWCVSRLEIGRPRHISIHIIDIVVERKINFENNIDLHVEVHWPGWAMWRPPSL